MDNSPSLFGRFHTAALLVVFLAALAIRLYDLTDLPLDFHPTRQLFSALKARGIYYQSLPDAPAELRAFAIQQGRLRATIEPEIMERFVAFTWKFTGEGLWVARIYSSLFWLIGGLFLYLLACDLFAKDAALFAAAFYLLLPYAVIASRSFQPDPLMVMLLLGFWWAVNRWAQSSSWPYVLLASLLGGLAVFVKLNAAFFVVGGALGAALGRASFRSLLRSKQAWAMAALGILPGLGWVVYGLSHGFLGQQFGGRFLPALFLSPNFYLGWAEMLDNVLGLFVFALALLGLLLADSKPARSFLLGLWAAYFAFAVFFNYHISTHDYYSLPLVPIAALALTPLADAIVGRIGNPTSANQTDIVERIGNPPYARQNAIPTYAILTLCLLATLWTSRTALKSADYRPQAGFWRQIGGTVRGYRLVALTQDYGLPLAYWGWTASASWPDSSDLAYHALRGGGQTFEKYFGRLTKNKDLFLVTDLADLKRQPELQARLSHFSIFAEGEGYIIYNLKSPLP